ncbi:MAG: biotin transporter BioY [candidate division KSB1 bacterium]
MKTTPTSKTRMLVFTSLFTALTVVGAQLRVPLPPVPLSLQDFFVVLAGLMLGPKYGALSQVLYLVLGLAGLPVFAQGGGPAYVLQPTFGYLLGFPLASFIAGKIIHRNAAREIFLPAATWPRLVLACTLAVFALLMLGVFYLWLNTNWIVGKELKLVHAIYVGAIVFLPTQAIKIFAAALLYRALQPRLALNLNVRSDAFRRFS